MTRPHAEHYTPLKRLSTSASSIVGRGAIAPIHHHRMEQKGIQKLCTYMNRDSNCSGLRKELGMNQPPGLSFSCLTEHRSTCFARHLLSPVFMSVHLSSYQRSADTSLDVIRLVVTTVVDRNRFRFSNCHDSASCSQGSPVSLWYNPRARVRRVRLRRHCRFTDSSTHSVRIAKAFTLLRPER